MLICLIFCIFIQKEIITLIKELPKKTIELKECKDWCNEKGLLIRFTEEDKKHCLDKCDNFSYRPPILNFVCDVSRKFDYYFFEIISSSETCIYYKEVNSLSVIDGVKIRWYKAFLKKREFFGNLYLFDK